VKTLGLSSSTTKNCRGRILTLWVLNKSLCVKQNATTHLWAYMGKRPATTWLKDVYFLMNLYGEKTSHNLAQRRLFSHELSREKCHILIVESRCCSQRILLGGNICCIDPFLMAIRFCDRWQTSVSSLCRLRYWCQHSNKRHCRAYIYLVTNTLPEMLTPSCKI